MDRRRDASPRALTIAAEILPYLSDGLTRDSAERVCATLRERSNADAVGLTHGDGVILATCGDGVEHHAAGGPYRTKLVGRVLTSGEPGTARTARAIGCVVPDCRLTAGIAAPILVDGSAVAVLSAWRIDRHPLGRGTVDLVLGIAGVIAARLSAHEGTGEGQPSG